ncbi:hypothetical protein TWF217_009345 [Orbilia oligospora]|nr:hypothetical protein TWF751_004929 [Orbilia oligospora]KAF3269254.1 hypothetical protein TWF217_009345 [Orbilia oligospora]KAF3284981.1 hypothetical protein TWF132_009645 [Orbilia oligospora]
MVIRLVLRLGLSVCPWPWRNYFTYNMLNNQYAHNRRTLEADGISKKGEKKKKSQILVLYALPVGYKSRHRCGVID